MMAKEIEYNYRMMFILMFLCADSWLESMGGGDFIPWLRVFLWYNVLHFTFFFSRSSVKLVFSCSIRFTNFFSEMLLCVSSCLYCKFVFADPSRFRLTHETSFVRAHTRSWTRIPILFYIVRSIS